MKNRLALVSLAWLSLCFTAFSQNCEQKFKDAEAAERRGDYLDALRKFNAARKCDASFDGKCEVKIEAMFKKIDGLRKEAENAKHKANTALAETQKAKFQADNALKKKQKLIDAFYFYDDKYALAFQDKLVGPHANARVYYFIDKNGDPVFKLGNWIAAEQFNSSGYAKVKDLLNEDQILDTFGVTYRVAFDSSTLSSETIALDLSNQKYQSIPPKILKSAFLNVLIIRKNPLINVPKEICDLKNLIILDLSENYLFELPDNIGCLKSLSRLNLSENGLKSLPESICDLKYLTKLDLSNNLLEYLPKQIDKLTYLKHLNLEGNSIPKPEQEKIKQLLPWCKIEF